MSVQKRREKALLRRQWVTGMRCKWDVRLGRDEGCHNAPWSCDFHPREDQDAADDGEDDNLATVSA